MKEKIIIVDNMSFSYSSNRVLENVSFSIEEGDFVGIIGANGSAKSTLIKLMIGLLKPNIGNVYLFGKEINEFNDYEKIGYISQNVREFNPMFPATVEEIIGVNIYSQKDKFIKLKKEEVNNKINEVLKIVDMEEFKKRKIGNLSGGQKQRVFIARALTVSPKILFMDEPLVGIDLESQKSFYTLMNRLNNEFNMTIVMVSHDIGVISQKANKILCLNEGRVYYHDLNKCQCGELLKEVYKKDIDILFHDH